MPGKDFRALLFDVFGTVVDWRSSIIHELEAVGAHLGIDADWVAFADAWRGLYQPSMEQVRSGQRPWCKLDDLHHESLVTLLERFGVHGLTGAQVDDLNRAWHRLDPWPDTVAGLNRLRRKYILATLSNGNVALLVNMARHANLPWDAVLGAETARCYKPLPESFLRTADHLGLDPEQCVMVAAHNQDLHAAHALGFGTAFVCRPTEYGPDQQADLEAESDWDFVADSLTELAAKMGA